MTYVPSTDDERSCMLREIGAGDVSELFDPIPDDLVLHSPLDIPGPLSEMELARHMYELSRQNRGLDDFVSFLGAGVYDHYVPATVNAITGRSEFYTSYTPYQPEVSQGNLQSIFEFQSLICSLTGMEVANASMYDGATALSEAALMASSITGRRQWLVSSCVHPAYLQTMRTYAWASGHGLIETRRDGIVTDLESVSELVSPETACVIVQHPNFFGALESPVQLEELAHAVGALFIVCFDPISLGLLKPPGELNADICVGEGQPLGIHPQFGGPMLGLFACKRQYVRQMPGRVVGATEDSNGRRGYTLTLQTREQHIRRERATSNICTNEALNALAAAVYLSTLGRTGLRRVAELCLQKAHYAADMIANVQGCSLPFPCRFFKEFVIKTDSPVADINARLAEQGIIGGFDLGQVYPDLRNHMLLCVTEKRTRAEIEALVKGLSS